MFTYRLHLEDGSDVGEATYPSMVKVGEELFFSGVRRFRMVDVVIFEEENESPFVGLLRSKPPLSRPRTAWNWRRLTQTSARLERGLATAAARRSRSPAACGRRTAAF